MRTHILGSLTALLAGSGLALAQAPNFPVLVFKADPALVKAAAAQAKPATPTPAVSAPPAPAATFRPAPQAENIVQVGAPASPQAAEVHVLAQPAAAEQPTPVEPAQPAPPPAQPAGETPPAPATTKPQAAAPTQAVNKDGDKKKEIVLEPFGPFRELDEPLEGMCGRFYAQADYLLWFAKGQRLPPLVTSGAAADGITVPVTDLVNLPLTSITLAGALGSPGTQLLFGNTNVDDDARSGGRLTAGFWLTKDRTVGIEASGFYLDPQTTHFLAQSSGPATLGQPVATPLLVLSGTVAGAPPAGVSTLGPETSILTVEPGVTSGSINVFTRSRLWGAEANARFNVKGDSCFRFDLLVGFRYLNLEDELEISSSSQPIAPNNTLRFQGVLVPGATNRGVVDSFRTSNAYYAGQIGAEAEVLRGNWFLNVYTKAALGIVRQTVTITGESTLTTPAGTTAVTGGYLAQLSNIGHHSRDEFGFMPEVGINLGYQFNRHLRAYAGYSILYAVSDIVRAGDQIDRTVDFAQVPRFLNSNQTFVFQGTQVTSPGSATITRPQFGFRDSDFWVQGLNAGIAIGF